MVSIMESLGYVKKSRLEEALKRNKALETQLAELRGEVSQASKAKEELQKKISELETIKSDLEKKHLETLKKNEDMEKKLADLEKKLKAKGEKASEP